MIKFTWLGFVCCGVVNGLIFSQVAPPEKYIYMGVVLLICCVLVAIHRHFTKGLVDENRDYDEDHLPIFIVSTLAVIILAIITVTVGLGSLCVGFLTAGFGFVLASIRESMYT